MVQKLTDISEKELIGRITRGRLPPSTEVLVDNGDDAAVFRSGEAGLLMVVSTDSLVEGVHFRKLNLQTGRKLMAVNLSDLASMGSRPRYALLSLHLDPQTEVTAVESMAEGLHQQAREHGVQLIGGNVTRTSGPAVLALTLLGETRRPLERGSAKPKDAIFVTGFLGDARAGLEVQDGPLYEAQVDPVPRVQLGIDLSRCSSLTAMCDVSDGLANDIQNLVGPSLGARLQERELPVSRALREHAGEQAFEYALQGGEDYELLFTASNAKEIELLAQACDTPITKIGEVLAEAHFELEAISGETRGLTGGFDHFGQNLKE